MNCPICSQPVAPNVQPEYFTLLQSTCHNHVYPVRIYSYREDPEYITSYTFYTTFKGTNWKVCYEMEDEEICEVSCLAVRARTDTKTTFYRKVIAKLTRGYRDHSPILTPENILRKLPTIITFS